VPHFERRLEALDGKAMVFYMSRRICVKFYKYLRELPGCLEVAVVMTDSASDPEDYQPDTSILKTSF